MKKGIMTIEQMESASESLKRFRDYGCHGNPYVNLASAIVSVAADDYRTALKDDNAELKLSLENFFYSEWFRSLTTIDPNDIITRIIEEFAPDRDGFDAVVA